MLGDYASSCGSWSLYSATANIPMALSEAIIATYMTIHMARSPGSHSGSCPEFRRERKSCGCGFQATKARFVLSDEPILLAKGIVMQASRSPVREHSVSGRRGFQWGLGRRGAPGRAMNRDRSTHKRRRKHDLEAKAEEFSAFAAHSWASGTRDWN
jgi:hypothetical protein